MKKSFIKDTIILLAEAAVIVFILINFVLMPCVVEGSSMYDNLHNGDFGYSFIFTKSIGIRRFDIAVIKIDQKLLVKRVIGLPGETISYKDNKLYVNGEYYAEDFLGDVTTSDLEIRLNDDEYYCLGDNRNISRDSRFYGAFSSGQIVSTHLLVIYPFRDFGFRK